jgi:glycosyltransferase involved in cell wall biosynthesis
MDSWFADLCLVVVGPERFVPLEWRDKAQTCDYSRPIIYLGFVPTSALPDLYRAALAYVTASNDEGFGLTILEAMSNDTPVICSDIPAHREVAGAAAEFFEPNSEDSLVDSLRKVLGNAQLRQRLIAAGKENLKRFTWEACAQSYLELFHSLIS